MSTTDDQFARRYVELWATEDPADRHRLADELYTEDAAFFAPGDPEDIALAGRPAIEANIAHVNERDVQGHGLGVEFVGAITNNELTRISWRLVAPDGSTAAPGSDLLTLDDNGRIATDHIFIG